MSDPREPPRDENRQSWESMGAAWCAEQMATNWPRNRYGSLLTNGEYEALVAELAAVRAERPTEDPADLCDLCGAEQWEESRRFTWPDGVTVGYFVCAKCAVMDHLLRRGAAREPPKPTDDYEWVIGFVERTIQQIIDDALAGRQRSAQVEASGIVAAVCGVAPPAGEETA